MTTTSAVTFDDVANVAQSMFDILAVLSMEDLGDQGVNQVCQFYTIARYE